MRDYQAWLRLEANFLATRHVHFPKQIIAKEYTVTAAESAYKTLVQAEVEATRTWEVQDSETKDSRSKLRTAKRKAAHAASALEKIREKIHKAKCLKRKLNVQQKRQQQILDESSTGLAQAAKARGKASSEASKAEHNIDALTAEILALEATLSAAVEAGQKKRSSHKNLAQIEALEAELKQLEHRLGTTNLDQYQTQLETTRKRSAELDTSCIAVQRSLVALRESNDGASRDIDKHATVLNVASSALALLQQELSSLDRQYNKSLTTIRTLKELWSSGKASRIRAAVHELSSKNIGVIGLLCELATCKKKDESDVNAVFGGLFATTVVVQTRNDAYHVTKYFKEQKIGRVCVSILDEIAQKSYQTPMRCTQMQRQQRDKLRLLLDLFDFDPQHVRGVFLSGL